MPSRIHDLVRLYTTQFEDECADQDGREEAMERVAVTCHSRRNLIWRCSRAQAMGRDTLRHL